MVRDTFSAFHPLVNLLYFTAVIGFSMFFMHPVFLAVSLVNAVLYSVFLGGKKAVRTGLLYLLPMAFIAALLNPMFNHQGVTILTYLPNGNPLTFESVVYGIAAAAMLITVIAWFCCWSAVMTSDKFIYLFGRIIPALSLILSMALRFIPLFRKQIKIISNAQKCIGYDTGSSIWRKIKHSTKILSILVTWSLENAIETADSMKHRGYGLPGRTAFSIFRFEQRDKYAITYILACTVFVIVGTAAGAYHFRYFPSIRGQWTGSYTIAMFIVYLALCALPLTVNLKEAIIWKRIQSKI